MTYSTEADKRFNELKQDVRTCLDPYELMAEILMDNERLRRENKELKGIY